MTDTTRVYVRRLVQGVSIMMGVLGMFSAYLGLRFMVGAVTDRDCMSLIVVPMLLGFGGIMVAVAYQVVFRYSPSAIASICTLIGFAVFGLLSHWLRVMRDDAWNRMDMAAQFVWQMLPIAVAWISYRILKGLLVRLTIKQAR